MKQYCPICKLEMTEERIRNYIDYACYNVIDTHSYRVRLLNDVPLIIRARLMEPNGSGLFLRMNFEKGISNIWQSSMNQKNEFKRITINHVFAPDWSQIDKLKNKLKTYLVFS